MKFVIIQFYSLYLCVARAFVEGSDSLLGIHIPYGIIIIVMKSFFAKILLAAALISFPTRGDAMNADERERVAERLSVELKSAGNANDSIAILNNLYDLYTGARRDSVGKMLLHSALVAGDDAVGLDMIRNMTKGHTKSDSLLEADVANAMKFPESADRDETLAFIGMMKNINRVRFSTDDEKEAYLRALLRDAYVGNQEDIYENIVSLHGICIYLRDYAPGELLSKYLGRLGELINQLPEEAYAIRNSYYVQAALAYAENDEPEKSIATDRKLLEAIDGLERGDIGINRKYRNYDGNRYTVYTRLLSNYKKLDAEEIEKYYKEVMRYVANDSLSATTNRISMRPQIYYAMYKKDYARALDLLKTYINYPYNATARRRLLKMMVEAAEKTGDNDALLIASRNYNEALEQTLDSRAREKYRELQIIYDLSELKAEHARQASDMQRKLTVSAIVLSAVLLVLCVISFLLWRHSRRLANKLTVANAALSAESTNLRQAQADLVKARDDAQLANRIKSDFIKNMSGEVAVPLHAINEYTSLVIDCSEAGVKPYLRQFAELIALNTELLTSIVNDVLNLSEIDSNSVEISMKREPLKALCTAAVDSVRHKVNPGVEISIDESAPEMTIYTDPRRLMQILVQLLSNAAKFTKSGSIKVGFETVEGEDMVRISVTDTGIGVSPENAERIFERFVKLDRSSQGVGIGLPIARHLADLLAGSLTLDTTYSDGARFIVTVPLG